MGLSGVLARAAARHAHALVVEVPGWWRTRVEVEHAVLARGWQLAPSPADADVLVVCGVPGRGLRDAVELVWHQMPGPRVRVEVQGPEEAAVRLDEAHARLLDTARHRDDALRRPDAEELLARVDGDGEEHEDHDDHGHGDHEDHEDYGHADHEDHEDHGHADHGGHGDHGDMEMAPGGIPLAEGGPDRDGLEMDVLTVRLGPVLPHWPAGLVLHCSLQGDVVGSARAELLDATGDLQNAADGPARRLDRVASVLALAGWDDAAGEARRVRDAILDGGPEPTDAMLARLRRKVCRSWVLRRSLRGLRPLDEDDIDHHGLPVSAVGDSYDRLTRMLDRAVVAGDPPGHESGPAISTDHLAHLVTGLDLATARLVVAGLDVHDLRAGQVEHEVAHG
ncbi:hypothetical protein [Ornithinimicrobium sediminis]|uniref:hypothetical protein n=1 Tax=Ornithinimicrobium sediminis TaxID=2904603 RepID=UPI001E4CE33D|nr:hypothetical protein [Ornithinimicrobium sediminis]MCE0487739.1 hypothetical protein [Ornithinimicrobium sediminis]